MTNRKTLSRASEQRPDALCAGERRRPRRAPDQLVTGPDRASLVRAVRRRVVPQVGEDRAIAVREPDGRGAEDPGGDEAAQPDPRAPSSGTCRPRRTVRC